MEIKSLNFKGLYLIALLFAFIIAITIFMFSPDFYLKSLAIDDALYFPVVARNIATGNGSTFDNITKTNGYHPLWCWINIPFSLLSKNNMARLFIFKGLLVIIVLAMLLIWDSLLCKLNFPLLFRSYFLLFLGCSYWWSIKVFYSGMETALTCLFIGLDFHLLIEFNKGNLKKTPYILGLLLSLTFLSRLDTVFLLITIFGTILFIEKRLTRNSIRIVLTGSLVIIPYLYYNLVKFGNFIPLSGVKKARIGNIPSNLTFFLSFIKNETSRMVIFVKNTGLVLGIAIFILCVLYIFSKRHIKIFKESGTDSIFIKFKLFIPLFIATFLHFLYTILFMSEMHVNWYQYFIYLSLFLLLSGFLTYIQCHFNIGILLFPIISIMLIIMAIIGFSKYPRPNACATIEAGEHAKSHLNNQSVFIMNDPGIFRYVSEVKTLAGNGLIGDRILMELALKNQNELIKKYGVNYVVDIFPSNDIRKMGEPLFVSKSFNVSGISYSIAIYETVTFLRFNN